MVAAGGGWGPETPLSGEAAGPSASHTLFSYDPHVAPGAGPAEFVPVGGEIPTPIDEILVPRRADQPSVRSVARDDKIPGNRPRSSGRTAVDFTCVAAFARRRRDCVCPALGRKRRGPPLSGTRGPVHSSGPAGVRRPTRLATRLQVCGGPAAAHHLGWYSGREGWIVENADPCERIKDLLAREGGARPPTTVFWRRRLLASGPPRTTLWY